MCTNRLFRHLALPLFWAHLDLEVTTDAAVTKLHTLIQQDPDKARWAKSLWLRSILDQDELEALPPRHIRRDAIKATRRGRIVVKILQACQNLQDLDVDYYSYIHLPLPKAIEKHGPSLTNLTIACNEHSVPEEWIAPLLCKLPLLTYCRVDSVASADSSWSEQAPALGPALASLSNLQILHLWECEPLTDDWATLNWTTRNMEQVAFDECQNLSQVGLDALLARFTETLKVLELDLTPVGPAGPGDPLAKKPNGAPADHYSMPNLEALVLGQMSCGPEWIDRFSTCPRLRMLQFEDLSNCGLTPHLLPAQVPDDNPRLTSMLQIFSDTTKWRSVESVRWDVSATGSQIEEELARVCELRGWTHDFSTSDSDDNGDDFDTDADLWADEADEDGWQDSDWEDDSTAH